jgi:hypothetical protein
MNSREISSFSPQQAVILTTDQDFDDLARERRQRLMSPISRHGSRAISLRAQGIARHRHRYEELFASAPTQELPRSGTSG